VLVPAAGGGIAAAVLGLGKGDDPLALATFSENLPHGAYALGDVPEGFGGARAALAWALGHLSLRALPQAHPRNPEAGRAARCRWRRGEPRCGRRVSHPRSRQHAVERYGAGGAWRRRARSCEAPWREDFVHRRRRIAQGELSADPCGGPRLHARAASDRSALGPARRTQGDAGRQRRVLRFRRSRSQELGQYADHEEGHGGRRAGAGPRAYDHGRESSISGCGC
jgi:hypothetical protein